ncbi:Odorant receptor 80, partial [Frankliniella occidentalis]
HGFGRVDRSACLTALKSWFSILQMLLNLRS